MRKIKVLHIGIKNFPFNETFKEDSLEGLRGGGMNKYCNTLVDHSVDRIEHFVIVQRIPGQQKYENLNGVHIYRVKTWGGRRVRQLIAVIQSFFLSFKIIRKNKIEVIHGHMIQGIFFAYLLKLRFKKKMLGTPYSFVTKGFSSLVNALARLVERKVYPFLDVLVFETNGNLKKAEKAFDVQFNNAIVIHTGIDVPFVGNAHVIKEKINVFYIGRIVPVKAIGNLVEALTLLSPSDRNKVQVDIIGEGELLEKCRLLAASKNLNGTISFHGFVLDTEPFFRNADIFILPSYMEGLSISLLESMSYGKACIVNDFGLPFSNEEIYTLKNNQPETIANALSYFINNKNQIRVFGSNARARIQKDFTVEAFADKYVALYRRLAHQK